MMQIKVRSIFADPKIYRQPDYANLRKFLGLGDPGGFEIV
jgi:hypothetical protein